MDKVFSNFSLYDSFAYLLVGAISILVVGFDARYFFQLNFLTADFFSVTAVVVIAYFLGHIIQAIANVITSTPVLGSCLREAKVNFSTEDKEILSDARTYFRREKASDAEAFRYCMIFANANDIAGQVKSFNAYYSLCRGWFVIFFLESVFLLIATTKFNTASTWLFFALSVIIAILTQRRAKRFWNYFRQKVFETFVVASTKTN
jgi:hypothetical protein